MDEFMDFSKDYMFSKLGGYTLLRCENAEKLVQENAVELQTDEDGKKFIFYQGECHYFNPPTVHVNRW